MTAVSREERVIARAAQRISTVIVAFEVTAISIIFFFMVYAVLTQVVTRYLLNEPSPWTEESARYSFVWLSMLGAALGVRRRSHFGFDVAVRALPAVAAKVAGAFATCIIFAVVALLAWQGWKLMQLESFSTGPATGMPMVWIYAAIPVGAVLIMSHIVLEALGAKHEHPQAGDLEGTIVQAAHGPHAP